MCNLYNIVSDRQAVLDFTKASREDVSNFERGKVYPDYSAIIVRNCEDGGRELVNARWGMPSPQFVLGGRNADPGVTNVRNTTSPHWMPWLGVEHRCIVPANSFSEFGNTRNSETNRVPLHHFALSDDQPLFCFAGVWTRWTGVRTPTEGEVEIDVFAFLTCKPNAIVSATNIAAMPVILTRPEELDTWLAAPWDEAKRLQGPLPNDELRAVDGTGRPRTLPRAASPENATVHALSTGLQHRGARPHSQHYRWQ